MRILLITFLLFLSFQAFSQGPVDRIELGYQTSKRGIEWTRPGLPTHVPVWRVSRDTNTIIWHDKNTGIRYDWDYLTSVWYARGRFSSALPPLPTQTSGLAAIDNRTGFWLNASNILHRYDITQTAWVPLKITYQSAAPTNVAAGVSNGAAVYTTTLWQDSDDFLIRFWDGDSWELIGGGTDLTFSGASSPVTLNSSTGTDVTHTAGTGISLTGTSSNMTITNTAPDQTVSITGAGINVVTGTYPNFTITGTEVDGSISNEGSLTVGAGAGTTSIINSNTSGSTGVTLTAGTNLSISEAGNVITLNNTGAAALSGVVNQVPYFNTTSTITTEAGSGANALTWDATNNRLGVGTASPTARLEVVDGNIEQGDASGSRLKLVSGNSWRGTSTMYFDTETTGDIFFRPGYNTSLTLKNAGNVGIGTTTPNRKLEVFGEARITDLITDTPTRIVGADADGDLGELALSGMSISSGTLTATDGSTTNELQTLAHTSNSTSHTATLSNSGGSLQLIEGAGVLLTTGGTGLNGTVTIEAIDPSTTNEIQTLSASGAGPSSYNIDLNLSGGSVTLAEGTGIDLTRSTNTITVTNSAPDQTVSITGAGINVVTGTYPSFTVTGTEVDGSVTNEGVLGVGAGIATSSTILSTTSGANAVTINAAGILGISESTSANGGSITLTATEVDGSTTNELQTIANTSNSTSHTATLSNSGGSLQIIEGAGVLLTTGGTGLNGTVTIEAIDPSTTNEIQTYSASGAGPTSYDMTVSSGGTVTLAEGAGIDLTRSGNTITVASTATSGWLLDGNTITSAKRIGSNDNFDVVVETNGTDRMWFDNGGTVSIGATQLTTAALNINGLQNGIGQLIAGGSGLVTPSFYQATGSGSGSSATVFSGVISMLNGNVEALIQNTSASGSGGVVMELNSKTGTGDPRLYMTIDGTTDWSIGIDNDDVDNLKLHRFAAPSDNNGVGTMEFGYDGTSLGVAINKTGIGTAANAHYGLDVGGKVRGDQFVNNNPTSFTTGTIALGTAAGTGPSLDTGVSEFWGNGGRLKFTSGTSPTTNGVICTVTLGTEYTFEECAPIMQGRTTNTGGFDYVGTFNSGTRVITYTLIGTLAASTAYEFNLIVSGHN